jgi:hypothetical protein
VWPFEAECRASASAHARPFIDENPPPCCSLVS